MQLKWTDVADRDLSSIEAYITADTGPVVVIDVVMTIIDTAQLILPEHPLSGRRGRVKNTRELVVGGLPFIIIYREQPSCIEILRVLHTAQQWPTS